jgi:hypothetical protein
MEMGRLWFKESPRKEDRETIFQRELLDLVVNLFIPSLVETE